MLKAFLVSFTRLSSRKRNYLSCYILILQFSIQPHQLSITDSFKKKKKTTYTCYCCNNCVLVSDLLIPNPEMIPQLDIVDVFFNEYVLSRKDYMLHDTMLEVLSFLYYILIIYVIFFNEYQLFVYYW